MRLAMDWKLLPFAPGKVPSQRAYSQSSTSMFVLAELFLTREAASEEPPQVEAWPYWFTDP